jgi:hypothetical protein
MEQRTDPDTRNTFLSRADVIERYGWGRTKGYLVMSSPGFPRAIAGDRYRLDTVTAWEDAQLAPLPLTRNACLADAILPAPRRPGRRKAI